MALLQSSTGRSTTATIAFSQQRQQDATRGAAALRFSWKCSYCGGDRRCKVPGSDVSPFDIASAPFVKTATTNMTPNRKGDRLVAVSIVETAPIEGQKPGTSGRRKQTRVFMQPHYLENYVQALFAAIGGVGRKTLRSEEHTSELQSLMRISYAVFCLKKKKTTLHTI